MTLLKFLYRIINWSLKLVNLHLVKYNHFNDYQTRLNSVQLCNFYNLSVKNILHIGGNTAQEAIMYKRLKVPRVVFIEALPNIYDLMLKKLKMLPGYSGLNYCLSNGYGTRKFYVSNFNGKSSSLLKPLRHKKIYPQVTFDSVINVETVPLDSLGLHGFDLIVIDVQGAEHLVIDGGKETISSAKAVYLECNSGGLYEGDTDLNTIVKILDENFILVSVITNSAYSGDALFINRGAITN